MSSQIALIKQEKQKEITSLELEIDRLQLEITGLRKTVARKNSEEYNMGSSLKEIEIEPMQMCEFPDSMVGNYLSVREDNQQGNMFLQRSLSIGPEASLFESLNNSPQAVEPIVLGLQEEPQQLKINKNSPDISNFQSTQQYTSVVVSDVSGLHFNKQFQEEFEAHNQQVFDNYEKALETSHNIIEGLQESLKEAKKKQQFCEKSLAYHVSELQSLQADHTHLIDQLTKEKFEHAKVLNQLSKYISSEKKTQRRSSNLQYTAATTQPNADSGSSSSANKSQSFFSRFF